MKKLMISTIIILPLIILAIMLVSGAIKALLTHIYVESVEFVDDSTLVLVMDDEENPPSAELEVTVLPLKAVNRELLFTMGDDSIATVDKDGKVVAKYYGTTYITVTSAENSAKFAQRKVLVTDRHVHNIVIGDHVEEMYRGDESQRLLAEVFPAEASNKNIIWSSSNPEILSVNESNGFVTCLGSSKHLEGGAVTITATSADDPHVQATTTIVCCEPLGSISAEETPVVTAKKTAQFPTVVPYPEDATYAVEYSSSNTEIATVNGKGEISFLEPGRVIVTATARDGREHSSSVSVTYDSTYGYYEGPLFGTTREYTFDYDEIHAAGTNGKLNIHFLEEVPEGSYQKITGVTFVNPDPQNNTDIIRYDADAKSFFLNDVGNDTPLGDVQIIMHGQKYDKGSGNLKEIDDDVCTVHITRKTAALSFVAGGKNTDALSISNIAPTMGVTFSELERDAQNAVVVRATPANHTDEIQYSLDGVPGCAKLEGKLLNFTQPGTATVVVKAGTAEKKLMVTFTQKDAEDKDITLSEKEPEQNIALDFVDEGNNSKGILSFVTPQGYVAKIKSENEDIIRIDGQTLVPLKGGFADITVSFEPALSAGIAVYAAGAPVNYTVRVYVDKPVMAGDITFAAGDVPILSGESFVTSKSTATLTVSVSAKDGAMEGKEFWLAGTKMTEFSGEETRVYTKEFTFEGAQTLSALAVVKYSDEAIACGIVRNEVSNNCKLQSTDGKITSGLTVKNGETAFTDGRNQLLFSDLGAEISLTVTVEDPQPADFVLGEHVTADDLKKAWQGNQFVTAAATVEGNSATLTLTAKTGTNGAAGAQTVIWGIAGKNFTVVLDIQTPADMITVTYGDRGIVEEDEYTTFLSALEFTVTLSRLDGNNISDECKKLTAAVNGQPCTARQNGGERSTSFTVTVPLNSFGQQTLEISGEGGHAAFSVALQRLDIEQCTFTYHIEYTYGAAAGKLPSLPLAVGEDVENVFFFPRGLNKFEIHITPEEAENRLGGFEGESEVEEDRHFTVTGEGWEYVFHTQGNACYLEVQVPEGKTYFYDEQVTFRCPDGTAKLVLTGANIGKVEMKGYDGGNQTDVYKGYQQVRVFAKQSDYGDGVLVDYFRVPFEVESEVKTPGDPADAIWNFTRHNDKTGEVETLTHQVGTTVTYKGETYTIEEAEEGPSTLTKGEEIIAQGGKFAAGAEKIPWVDVFAQEGYAHIYFGNFGGLTETDVQNDYFGNFGEKEDWKIVDEAADDGSGRQFGASENAYTYLRVDVGDCAEGSEANTHFNFNVLEGDLVNVFNAAGYYKNSNIVLHENLYGDGELGTDGDKFNEATQKGLFLNEVASLGKTLIYGNGYQINLQAKTASMAQYSESDGITINRAYNTVIKCANPNDEISKANQKMVFKMAYAYYCDLSYYYKFNPAGSAFYAKNTIFSGISKTAVQLYYNESMYAENCVFTECGTAIQVDNSSCLDPHIYIKGSFDALNYFNNVALDNLNPIIGMLYPSVVSNVKDYLEWHGKTFSANAGNYADKNVSKIYVNILLFGYAPLTENMFVWDGDSYEKATPLQNGSKIVSKSLYAQYHAWTYDTLDENGARLDGATVEANQYGKATVTADMSQLFTEKRYIRLQCEFKEPGVKNYDHILWHRQEAYRDKSLLTDRKSHIDDLKESLKGTTWDDGSGVGADGIPFDPPAAAAMNALISETVIPSKRAY